MTASPLTGYRVVVTRAEHQAGSLGALLAERGADVLYLPVIAVAPPESWEALDAALRRARAGEFSWVLFTSANAVRSVLGRPGARGALGGVRIAAVGRATADVLTSQGLAPRLVPAEFTAASAAAALGPGPGRVLLPRAAGAPGDAREALRAAGWTPEETTAYRNVPAPRPAKASEVEARRFDAVTFASGSTARSFAVLVGAPGSLGLGEGGDKVVACIGPQTAAVARAAGYRVDVVAAEHSAAGLVEALTAYVASTRMAP